MCNTPLSTISDTELEQALGRLVARQRAATVELIVHLAEFDARRLYLGAGFSSLFTYCCGVLRLSESEAYNRIEVARLGRRLPRVLDLLRDGSLNMTTARLLAPHLTAENAASLLGLAVGRSRREVEELVAAQFPRPAEPALVRKLPGPMAEREAPAVRAPEQHRVSPEEPPPAAAAPVPALPSHRAEVAPLSAEFFLVKFTATAGTRDKLRLAQELLRHAVPSGDLAEIIDRALTVLLDDLARRKLAATDGPRPSSRKSAPGSRHVAADVRRAVWLRDCGRCAFVGRQRRRCDERGFLEFHHVDPYVLDRTASVDGIELRCRAHNAYEATLYFGPWKGSGKEAAGEGTSDAS